LEQGFINTGATQNKGIKLDGLKPVNLEEGASQDDLWIHERDFTKRRY
jgi:2-oxoglutarate ferredoxin oxidoreductase subunit beta